MRIAIDIRCLQSGTVSGVENYTNNLLEELLVMDKLNTYSLFYNSHKRLALPEFNYINAAIIKSNIPNRLLNLLFKLKVSSLESLIGDFDCLFMPNLNVINVRPNTKIILTVHDLSYVSLPEFYDLKRNLWHRFLNVPKLLKRADLIFAVSHYTKNDLIKYYDLPEEKIKVIYPGVDSQIFHPDIRHDELRNVRNIYGLPGEYFLCLNTLEPRKNLIGSIQAFEQIKSKSHLVIAGKKGWKTRQIVRKIQNSKKKLLIHYIGYVAEEHKPALLKMAKALLYPSFYEGFGFQALEAMAVGTPAIVSQITSLPEVVKNAAMLVDPYNLGDLIKAMDEFANNPALRDFFIKKGLDHASNFSWQITARQTLSYLEHFRRQGDLK